MAYLLKRQKGKCTHCGLTFQEWDVIEDDHVIPRALGGKDEWSNRQLMHRHCHDEKTKHDLIEIREMDSSIFRDGVNKFLSKFNWGWVNDIPVYWGLAGQESSSDKEVHVEQPCAVKYRKHGSEWETGHGNIPRRPYQHTAAQLYLISLDPRFLSNYLLKEYPIKFLMRETQQQLVQAFANSLLDGQRFETIVAARTFAESVLNQKTLPGTLAAKFIDESVEQALGRVCELKAKAE